MTSPELKLVRLLVGTILFALFASAAPAQTRQTDKEFDRMRGPVKTVVLEYSEFRPVGDQWLEQPRVLNSSVTYDKDGNWTQTKRYDSQGRLSESLNFSYLGKERVALADDVLRPDAIAVVTPLPRGTRIDPRYSHKFIYVYGKDGQRLQESHYLSGGFLALRSVFRRVGKRTVTLVYGHDGKLSTRTEALLDENGNELEVVVHPDDLPFKWMFQYTDFDAQKNWTKRIEWRVPRDSTPKDFPNLKPWSIEYRSITYY